LSWLDIEISKHRQSSSQWIFSKTGGDDKDECLQPLKKKKRCENLLGSVYHFTKNRVLTDELIAPQTTVYPFNPNGKLYTVNGTYVMAVWFDG